MNSTKTERTTYHLINLEDQSFFPGSVDAHQSLGMDKTQLMSAITSQAVHPFGLLTKTAAVADLQQSLPQALDDSGDSEVPERGFTACAGRGCCGAETEPSDIEPGSPFRQARTISSG
ncbi:hypothetical protein JTY93_23485 [Pseudomonas hygromyciniae]|uniref:Uncharacterized protein n=1 Tax=Pseudomonas hygromyciniae TaxID=2812000 RepID=A0ABX7JUV2_9PSED|nr:hypothetical protein [Pseudomonas hygromyciniae]QSB39154.1 hypothetical protein JTY93_23485 [Pseudomonas hygromyciniae]